MHILIVTVIGLVVLAVVWFGGPQVGQGNS